ncbi:MAG: hypothetical protein AB7F19_00575 [Candidatus Babeliales bacterium]
MNNYMRWSVLSICLVAGTMLGNEFIKEKRPKKVSVARLKEEVGELLGDSLLYSTTLVEGMGKLQKELMQMMAALMEQQATSKLTNADRLALDKTIDALKVIECDLAAMGKRLAHHTEVIKQQY